MECLAMLLSSTDKIPIREIIMYCAILVPIPDHDLTVGRQCQTLIVHTPYTYIER